MGRKPPYREGTKTASQSGAMLMQSLARLAGEALAPAIERALAALEQGVQALARDAEGTQDEQRFLDFLRALRRSRAEVLADAGTRVTAELNSLVQRSADQPRRHAETLELVAQEQIEKQVLLAGSVARVRTEHHRPLYQLQQRMQAIVPAPFNEHENPLDPARIAQAILDACAPLEADGRLLKLLCSQIDTHVLSQLGECYGKANQLLVSADVLPQLADPVPPSRSSNARASSAPEAGASGPTPPHGADATGDPALASLGELREISGLLQQLRGGGSASALEPIPAATAMAQPLSAQQLASMLGELREQSDWLGGAAQSPVDIRGALEAIAASRGRVNLARADEDVLSVVTLLFDTINEDRNLPPEIQHLIARLQLPVLRLALGDRGFFADREHPARELLNMLARAGHGWDANNKASQDSLLEQLSELVKGLLEAPAADTTSYRAALEKVRELSERAEQRAIKLERRTTEKAAAEARTAAARDAVHQVLRERLDDTELPTPILEFFVKDWQRVLQLFFLRRGTQSAEWTDAVQMVDDLLQSVVPPADEAARSRFEQGLEGLYQRLRNALAQTQSHTEDAEARVEVIRDMHRKLARQASHERQPVAALTRAKIEPPPLVPPRAPRPPPASSSLQNPPGDALLFESLKRADEIPVGTWLEYEDRDSRATRRCKLSARIDETRMLIFSDRLGMPVWEKPRKVFAYELQVGALRVIEDAPLVDRAMERITRTLREQAQSR